MLITIKRVITSTITVNFCHILDDIKEWRSLDVVLSNAQSVNEFKTNLARNFQKVTNWVTDQNMS